MPFDYAKQKLFEAVYALVGSDPIQQRLTSAAVHLVILRTPERELGNVLPRELHKRFFAVVDELTVEPLSSGAGPEPRGVTPEEGERIAREIFDLGWLMKRICGGVKGIDFL
jgi:hypothetical protein